MNRKKDRLSKLRAHINVYLEFHAWCLCLGYCGQRSSLLEIESSIANKFRFPGYGELEEDSESRILFSMRYFCMWARQKGEINKMGAFYWCFYSSSFIHLRLIVIVSSSHAAPHTHTRKLHRYHLYVYFYIDWKRISSQISQSHKTSRWLANRSVYILLLSSAATPNTQRQSYHKQ